MHIEFETITDMLLRNDDPLLFIQNQIRRFLNNKHSDFNISKKVDKKNYSFNLKITFHWQYISSHRKRIKTVFSTPIVRKIKFKCCA